MRNKLIVTALLAVMLLSAVTCNSPDESAIEQAVSNTSHLFAPDSRVALFDVVVHSENGNLLLKGETDLSNAKAA